MTQRPRPGPHLARARIVLALALLALLPLLALLGPQGASPVTAAGAATWHCDGQPAMSYKGPISQARNAVGATSGQVTDRLTFVGQYGRSFRVWFEDVDGQGPQFRDFSFDVPGFERHGGDANSLSPVAFAPTVHDNQLKIGVVHFRGNYPGSESNDPDRDLFVYRTGCRYGT